MTELEEKKIEYEEELDEIEEEAEEIIGLKEKLTEQREELEEDARQFLAKLADSDLVDEARAIIMEGEDEEQLQDFTEIVEDLRGEVNYEIADDDFYPTLLHLAVYYNRFHMVQILLEAGAEQVQNVHGQIPYDIAVVKLAAGDKSCANLVELLRPDEEEEDE